MCAVASTTTATELLASYWVIKSSDREVTMLTVGYCLLGLTLAGVSSYSGSTICSTWPYPNQRSVHVAVRFGVHQGWQRLVMVSVWLTMLKMMDTIMEVVHSGTKRTTLTDFSQSCPLILTDSMTLCVDLTTEEACCVENALTDMVLQFNCFIWNVLIVESFQWKVL